MGFNFNPNRPLQGFGQGTYSQSPYGGGGQAPPPAPGFPLGPGYVLPTLTNNELNDDLLRRFIQQLVVGITGLAPTLVFPRYQEDTPNQPSFQTTWAAVGPVDRTRDVFPAVHHYTDPNNFDSSTDTVDRNQILQFLCSFHGPQNEQVSEVLAMGLMLEQNRYALQLNGFALVEVGETLMVPAQIKNRWVRAADLRFILRRRQFYTYPSPNVKEADITLNLEQTSTAIVVKQ